MPISAEITMFLPRQVKFGRNKSILAEHSVSAEFRFFEMVSFGFRCFGKKSVSVEHYRDYAACVCVHAGGRGILL